jgi:coenzyme F420-reducing hydrogenase gamma subunit
MSAKPRIAVHKFASCDGCQLAFLNQGEALLELAALVDIAHFAEAGPVDPEAPVDIAFVEGSISTPHDAQRIQRVRAQTRFVVALGACATSGGIQALRNLDPQGGWAAHVYASPEYIAALDQSTGIGAHIKVDLELWGCPVSTAQLAAAVRSLLWGVPPVPDRDAVCLECKRHQAVCVLVTGQGPCMGPVTRTGCGAICPRQGRDCYGCYGPSERPNTGALGRWLHGLGLPPEAVVRRFHFINSAAPAFLDAGQSWRQRP